MNCSYLNRLRWLPLPGQHRRFVQYYITEVPSVAMGLETHDNSTITTHIRCQTAAGPPKRPRTRKTEVEIMDETRRATTRDTFRGRLAADRLLMTPKRR
jgi:hypothetical protein